MKNLKNLLMMIALMLPVIAFAKPANDYMLNEGGQVKVGDMVKCGTGSLMGNEYAHIYRVDEKGQVSLETNAAGSLMKVKSINAMDKKIILEDSKHVAYICEVDYAVKNAEVILIAQAAKTTLNDKVKPAAKPKASFVNNTVSSHIGSVLQRMNGNGTISNGELATLSKIAKR